MGDHKDAAAAHDARRVTIEAVSDAPIVLPNDPSVLTAEFERSGDALILIKPDGSVLIVENYFAQGVAPDLVVGGAVVPGSMVAKLARRTDDEVEAEEKAFAQLGEEELGSAAEATQDALTPDPVSAAALPELGNPIAEIAEYEGEVTIIRADGARVRGDLGSKLYEGDSLATSEKGAVGVEFIDGMTFSLGNGAVVVLDEFAWTPESNEGGGLFDILRGEFSFVSGDAAHTGDDALMIKTPTMTIGVRGTKVVSQINAEGEVSRIALLPEENGRIGKIMVMTDAGSELISEPYRMVEVASRFEPPSAQRELSTDEVIEYFGDSLAALPAPAEFLRPEIAVEYDTAQRTSSPQIEGGPSIAPKQLASAAIVEESSEPEEESVWERIRSDDGSDDAAAPIGIQAVAVEADEDTVTDDNPVEPIIAAPSTDTTDETDATVEVDVNDTAPVFTSGSTASAAEDVADNAVIYTATATDADTTGEPITFSIIDDASGLFEIDPSSGAVSLAAGQALDYEIAESHNITIRSSDGVNVTDQTIAISVTDRNDVGQVLTSEATVSAPESALDTDILYVASVSDADTTGEAITFSLTNSASGLFEIDADTGEVSLSPGRMFDFALSPSHTITIQSSDGVNTTEHDVTINLTPNNSDPTLAIAGGVDFSQGDFAVNVGDPGPSNNALDPGNGDMTIEAWFYFDGNSGVDQTIVSKGNDVENNDAYSIIVDGTTLVVRVNTNGGAADQKTAASSIDLGSDPGWRHVAMVIDNTNGVVKGYLNGSDAGWSAGHDGVSNDTFTPRAIDTNADFLVGAADNNGSGYEKWAALPVSDVRAWSAARTQSEIAADMGRTLEGTETDLVLNLRLDEGGGDVLADSSSSGFDGNFYNTGAWLDPNTITTTENTAVQGRLTASDSDGDTLTFSIGTNGANGTAVIDANTGAWRYTPDASFTGTDTVSYQVSDGAGGTDTLSVTITVA